MTMNYRVICADSHVNPPATFWENYLPNHLKQFAPRIEPGDDADYIVFEGNRKKMTVLSALAGRKIEDYKMHGRTSDTLSGGYEVQARLMDMDKDGLDAVVIFGGGPLGTANRELFMESFDAYNRWIADFCHQSPERLGGIAYLPMADVQESIALMRRAAKLGLKGVNIPAFPMSDKSIGSGSSSGMQVLALTGDPAGPRQYRNEEFNPFWEAAIDLDMTLTIHLGGRSVRHSHPDHWLPDLVMSKVTMAEPIAILTFGGVFQRYPKLRVVSAESGVGWFAWLAEYMDSIWSRHRHWVKSVLENPPSYYLERNVYGSFIHDRVGVLNRSLVGAKNIMWSSDYPHGETSFPNSRDVIARTFSGVPEEDKYRITCGLAKELYHF
jgi:predicted TIM-barrel fold metal-dependent hydrolase